MDSFHSRMYDAWNQASCSKCSKSQTEMNAMSPEAHLGNASQAVFWDRPPGMTDDEAAAARSADAATRRRQQQRGPVAAGPPPQAAATAASAGAARTDMQVGKVQSV